MILMIGFTLAAPSLPHTFIGVVDYGGMDLEGYDISAKIGSYGLGVLDQVQSGNEFEVSVDPQGHSGTITFYVGGAETEPTFEYIWGGHIGDIELILLSVPINALCGNNISELGEQCDNLDLGIGTCENVLGITGATGNLSCTNSCTFNYGDCSAPVCGDGTCNNGEDCSSCSGDCGACAASGGGSGGGVGGGGSSSSSTSSSSSSTTTSEDTGSVDLSVEVEDEEIVEEEIIPEGGFGMTGSVVGFVKTKLGMGLIAGVLIIILGGLVIFMKRGKK